MHRPRMMSKRHVAYTSSADPASTEDVFEWLRARNKPDAPVPDEELIASAADYAPHCEIVNGELVARGQIVIERRETRAPDGTHLPCRFSDETLAHVVAQLEHYRRS